MVIRFFSHPFQLFLCRSLDESSSTAFCAAISRPIASPSFCSSLSLSTVITNALSFDLIYSSEPAVHSVIPLLLAFSRASSLGEVVVSPPLIFSVISLFTAVGSCSFIFAGDIGSLASYCVVQSYPVPSALSLEPTTVSLASFNLSLPVSIILLMQLNTCTLNNLNVLFDDFSNVDSHTN